jgi:hypothetical protein
MIGFDSSAPGFDLHGGLFFGAGKDRNFDCSTLIFLSDFPIIIYNKQKG